MNEPTMSKAAVRAQRQYYNVIRWENKAKKVHGKNYEPPAPGEPISAQALAIRREYQRNYRKEHPDTFKRAQCKYWERKAKNIEGV